MDGGRGPVLLRTKCQLPGMGRGLGGPSPVTVVVETPECS